MNDAQLFNEYYNKTDVLFELVKQMKAREVAFMDKVTIIRCAKIHNLKFLKKYFMNFDMGGKFLPNFYISVAKYENMPFFSFELNKRFDEQKIFRGTFENYVTDYDFFIDIDFKNSLKYTFNQTFLLYEFFKNFTYFSIRFSGNGFHIIIDGQFLNFIRKNYKIIFQRWFLESLVKKLDLDEDCIDLNVLQKRRIFKIPYSLDLKSGRVCYPLTEQEFLNIKDSSSDEFYNFVSPTNIFKNSVRNRGIPLILPEKKAIYDNAKNDLFKKFFLDNKEDFVNFLKENDLKISIRDIGAKRKK